MSQGVTLCLSVSLSTFIFLPFLSRLPPFPASTLYRRNPRASETRDNYATIDGMLKYEVERELADSGHSPAGGKLPSGSRTLLRLHRALEFVILFLGNLTDLRLSLR